MGKLRAGWEKVGSEYFSPMRLHRIHKYRASWVVWKADTMFTGGYRPADLHFPTLAKAMEFAELREAAAAEQAARLAARS